MFSDETDARALFFKVGEAKRCHGHTAAISSPATASPVCSSERRRPLSLVSFSSSSSSSSSSYCLQVVEEEIKRKITIFLYYKNNNISFPHHVPRVQGCVYIYPWQVRAPLGRCVIYISKDSMSFCLMAPHRFSLSLLFFSGGKGRERGLFQFSCSSSTYFSIYTYIQCVSVYRHTHTHSAARERDSLSPAAHLPSCNSSHTEEQLKPVFFFFYFLYPPISYLRKKKSLSWPSPSSSIYPSCVVCVSVHQNREKIQQEEEEVEDDRR